jgi:predicted transglutaminase-like cysteine proteinase
MVCRYVKFCLQIVLVTFCITACKVNPEYPAEVLKDSELIHTLADVNKYVNTQFKYELDKDQFKKEDYWQTPLEFLTNGKGDCEDFAVFKAWYLINRKNVDSSRLLFMMLRNSDRNIKEGHLILLVDGEYILDIEENKVYLYFDYFKLQPYVPTAVLSWEGYFDVKKLKERKKK